MTVGVFLDKKRLKVRNGAQRVWSLKPHPNVGKVLLSTKCCWVFGVGYELLLDNGLNELKSSK